MQVKLPLSKTNRVEIYFDKPNLSVKSLTELDSLLVSTRSPSVIINTEFMNELNLIKLQRNSQYNVIAAIDLDGKVFGSNKIYRIQNLIEADGFDIGLTANKNKVELINEIKAIDQFLKQASKQFKMRWVINSKHGPDHIDKCIDAIKESKVRYELISILTDNTDPKTAHNIVKKCRNGLGMVKCKMKISGKPSDDLIINDNNLVYQVRAEDLV